MIQDIRPHRLMNHYTEKKPEPGCLCFYVRGGRLLLREQNGEMELPGIIPGTEGELVFVFTLDQKDCFLYRGEAEESLPAVLPEDEGWRFENARSLRSLNPRHFAFAGVTALHLAAWYSRNVFCGRCGAKMEHDHEERMMKCPACTNMSYPSIAPAVIVAVTDRDRILMTKYAGREYARFALIAGFTEIGETAEETVAREVMEEAGIRVKNIRYYKSQPWGFSQTLLLGFFCELDGSPQISMDEKELSVAQWVERDQIAEIQDGYDDISLTNEMICAFRDGKA